MRFLHKITPEWALRATLGLMYLYSGIDMLRHPNAWKWAITSLPAFIENPITAFGVTNFLIFQGITELILAFIFLAWFMPRFVVMFAGLISALEMLFITLLVGLDAITFRDIGLVGSGLALYLILVNKNIYGHTSQ
jgi:hypothetical protein